MRYSVIQTKAGYAIQDTRTFRIVQVFPTRHEAENVALKLNS
jgi:hypothetical protein